MLAQLLTFFQFEQGYFYVLFFQIKNISNKISSHNSI